MKTFFKKIGTIILGSLFIASLISYGSLYYLRKSSFYKPSYLVNAVKETKFDYIILGASTGLTTLNTILIDSINGTKGINLSMDDTSIASQYLMLQHLLADGKKTDLVIVAPGISNFDVKNEGLSDNDYRFLMFVNRPYVHDYYQNHDGFHSKILSTSRWLPFLGMSFYNAELFYPSLMSILNSDKRNRFDDKGNYTYPVTGNRENNILNIESLQLNFNSGYLKQIKSLCDTNDIQLICYISPTENKNVLTNTTDYTIINHSRLLNNSKYFYDKDHVNSIGRERTSEAFAQELKAMVDPPRASNKTMD